MPKTPPTIVDELPHSLAVEIRAIHRSLKTRVRESGGVDGLTASQVAVLARLERYGTATVSSLARSESMRPQSMRELVAPLQERGLIDGTADPNDGRQTLLVLTPKCRQWINEGRAASHDWLAASLTQRLSALERQQLAEALALLWRVVEP